MNQFSDETLMAFADGEVDEATGAAVEAAMRDDPDIARRVARHRALRVRLESAFTAELADTPPARLVAAARGGAGAARRDMRRSAAVWRQFLPMAAMAACVLLGVGIGFFMLRPVDSLIDANGSALTAKGDLADALSTRLGADGSAGRVRIGLSFLAKSGEYCRVFSLNGAGSAGMACRQSNVWQIRALAQPAESESGPSPIYRTAGSALPPLLLDAIQQQIVGDPLDQAAEAAALRAGWTARPARR